ncbi:hypothetical protein EDD27_5733 [Nonomuraea polychroma]|uniref:Uncharacterized protein n=2 Tax=Nonomuraea polychroma TaxID=46176 RepID=A0A438MBG2_9ACTN|nr:hypothetical protein EDD27_5733 [Nonomuraea polychroma]
MAMTFPPEVHGMLHDMGLEMEPGDEDEVLKDSYAWRTVLAVAEPTAAGADAAVSGTRQAYHGEGSTALAGYWGETGGDGGHQSQAIAAARSAPVVLENTAWLTTGVKIAIGTAAVITTVRVARALLMGGPYGGALATAEMLRSRALILRVKREGMEGAGRVIAPALNRLLTQRFRRIVEMLRRPGGGGPTPALAGPGRALAGPRNVGPRATTGPSHVRDRMAAMGRSNKNARQGGNGRRGGGGRGGSKKDSTDGTTSHANQRQGQRGVSDDMVNQTIKNGQSKPGNQPGTTVHETQNMRVVTNRRGGIISVIRKNKK